MNTKKVTVEKAPLFLILLLFLLKFRHLRGKERCRPWAVPTGDSTIDKQASAIKL
jgi:hypothetical protein